MDFTFEEIIDFFELSKKKKQKVLARVLEHFSDKKPTDFDEVYTYIAKISDYSLLNYMFELDENILYKREKNEFFNSMNDSFVISKKISLKEVFKIYGHLIPEDQMQFINSLIESSNIEPLDFKFKDTGSFDISNLEERVNKIKYFLENDVRIVIQGRKILHIDPDIKNVVFSQRNYYGDPLKYYWDNIEKYRGLSRKQLRKIDQGLYSALRRTNQLKVAIPHTIRRNLSNPLDLFNKHYKGKVQTRTELFKIDQSLYHALNNKRLLDKVLPGNGYNYYNKNPLAIFKENIDKYKGLSRTQLSKVNRKLYRALMRHNQMDEAIPPKQ